MARDRVRNPEECNCPCHDHPGSRHVTACCNQCPRCGTRIKIALFNKHVQSCQVKCAINGDYWCADSVDLTKVERMVRGMRLAEQRISKILMRDLTSIGLGSEIRLTSGRSLPETSEVRVSFELSYPIKKIAVLRKIHRDPREKILIERRIGEKAIIPRNVNKYNLSASCDPDLTGEVSAYLIVRILPSLARADSLLDRGVCWVEEGNPGTVSLNLLNISKHLAQDEITNMLIKIKAKVDQTFNTLSYRISS